jgi:hypothetical protein
LEDAVRMVLTGGIRDSKTISSVLWLQYQVANKRDLHKKS